MIIVSRLFSPIGAFFLFLLISCELGAGQKISASEDRRNYFKSQTLDLIKSKLLEAKKSSKRNPGFWQLAPPDDEDFLVDYFSDGQNENIVPVNDHALLWSLWLEKEAFGQTAELCSYHEVQSFVQKNYLDKDIFDQVLFAKFKKQLTVSANINYQRIRLLWLSKKKEQNRKTCHLCWLPTELIALIIKEINSEVQTEIGLLKWINNIKLDLDKRD